MKIMHYNPLKNSVIITDGERPVKGWIGPNAEKFLMKHIGKIQIVITPKTEVRWLKQEKNDW